MSSFYCQKPQDFFGYFKENMDDLGLMVPQSLFGTQAQATATISTILATLKTFGHTATIGELIGATTQLEKLALVGALSASYYTGASIGSLAVATARYMSCGSSLADVFFMARRNGWNPPWLHRHLMSNPEIIDRRQPARSTYALRARTAVTAG